MMKRLNKIIHITTVPETLGFLSGQINYIKNQGFTVHGITSPGEIWTNPEVKDEFDSIERIEMSRRFTPVKDIESIFGIIKVLYRVKPVIVDAHTPKAGLLGMIAAWIMRIPVRIYHIHGFPFQTSTGISRVILKLTEKLSCFCSTQVICVSPSLMAESIKENLCKSTKIKVIGAGSINGLDIDRFDPSKYGLLSKNKLKQALSITENAIIIGFVGRLVKDKGIEDLVEAWKIVRTKETNVHLIIIGPHEIRNSISDETKYYLLSDSSIHVIPPTTDMPSFYSVMDMLVLPSYREGLPYVPLEAAAMELPVITTKVTGCVDAIIHEQTGFLVPPRDHKAIAESIINYLKNPALMKRHGTAGRRFVIERFSQIHIWESLTNEYYRLIEQTN